MTVSANGLPTRLQEIVIAFSSVEPAERLELLVEFSDKLPTLPRRLQAQRDNLERVHECMAPVYLYAEHDPDGMRYYFDIPPAIPTVRGYAALLAEGVHGSPPEQVMSIPLYFHEEIGLQYLVGPQRLKGLSALLIYMKRLAFQQTKK
jgi:cysteine desulfuration protein SufE